MRRPNVNPLAFFYTIFIYLFNDVEDLKCLPNPPRQADFGHQQVWHIQLPIEYGFSIVLLSCLVCSLDNNEIHRDSFLSPTQRSPRGSTRTGS